jgi:hypothetical protein
MFGYLALVTVVLLVNPMKLEKFVVVLGEMVLRTIRKPLADRPS